MAATTDCMNPACRGAIAYSLTTRSDGGVYQCPNCGYFQSWDAAQELWFRWGDAPEP